MVGEGADHDTRGECAPRSVVIKTCKLLVEWQGDLIRDMLFHLPSLFATLLAMAEIPVSMPEERQFL